MTIISRMRRVLILAPHPDDEVLGCGGTIARLVAEGAHVEVAVLTRGAPPRFDAAQAAMVRQEAERAHALLGVAATRFLTLPAAELDRVAHADLNAAIAWEIAAARPDTLFIPFAGDLHLDHRLIFESAMVAARPRGTVYPRRILAYETVSETNWSAPSIAPAFQPTVHIDISNHLETKLAAFALFESQCRAFPDERSLETLRALAMVRGSCVTRHAAEAFMMIREVG
jgi:LmbE family N-acetylglucosaminyl deacetylase